MAIRTPVRSVIQVVLALTLALFYISFAANIQQVTTKEDKIQNTVALIESHLADVARYIQERLPMKDPGDGPDWMIP